MGVPVQIGNYTSVGTQREVCLQLGPTQAQQLNLKTQHTINTVHLFHQPTTVPTYHFFYVVVWNLAVVKQLFWNNLPSVPY